MLRLKWHYHKNFTGALYKQQCHIMSAVTATVTTGAIMFGRHYEMPQTAAFYLLQEHNG